MKQYKKLLHFSLCFFIFILFFILVGAMSEIALESLRKETREKEVERKIEALGGNILRKKE
jgi:CHASE3 domain sensor protein